MGAGGGVPLQVHPQVGPGEVHRRLDGQVGIALAAAGPSHRSNPGQGLGRHPVGQAPGLPCQGGGAGGDGDIHPRADPCPAGPPKAAGAPRHLAAPAEHFRQGLLQVQGAPGVAIGGEQSRPHHGVVLRPVHVAERLSHEVLQDGPGVSALLPPAQGHQLVQAPGVAGVAVALLAPGLAALPPVAEGALHLLVLGEVDQRGPTDQTFLVHDRFSFTGMVFLGCAAAGPGGGPQRGTPSSPPSPGRGWWQCPPDG